MIDELSPQPEHQPTTGNRAFSMEERQLAFEVWAFRAGRNAAETARILAADYDMHLTDRAIRKWVGAEDWGTRANAELEELAPNIYAGIVTDLLHGAQAAANYIKKAAAGDRDALVQGRVDMGRVSASNIALQAAGFTPRQMKDAGRLEVPRNASNELAEFADAAEANRYWLEQGKQDT